MNVIIKNLSKKQLKAIKEMVEAFNLEMMTEEEFEDLEDQGLVIAMKEAENEGYLGFKESKKVIRQFEDEVKHYQKISKRSQKN